MKKIVRILVLLTAILGLNLTSFASDRMQEEGKGVKAFKPRGFILVQPNGITWAVVDDGAEITIYYQKGSLDVVSRKTQKEGTYIEYTLPGKDITSLILFEEAPLGRRPTISLAAVNSDEIGKLKLRFRVNEGK